MDQVATKQNALLQNSARLESDHYMMAMQTYTVKAPVLEDVRKSYVGQDDAKNFMALFDSLERFIDEITSNKLFWVSEVLSFFNIPSDSSLARQLTAEHEKHVKQVFSLEERNSMQGAVRRHSYSEDEIVEEVYK